MMMRGNVPVIARVSVTIITLTEMKQQIGGNTGSSYQDTSAL
jgi:hypothetical protein